MNLGYACINLSLGKSVSTNRTMMNATFKKKGASYVSELALKNSQDIIKILKWNVTNNIHFFRLSSMVIPWADNIDIESLPDYDDIVSALKSAGDYARANDIRITTHPGPFVVLSSPNEKVVKNSITNLETHGKLLDMMGLSTTPYNKINIHCNGVYGDKISAMDRFCKNYEKLSDSVKHRLTVENDDKPSMYSVLDLMYIHDRIKIPITFDYHHHIFCSGGLPEKNALELAFNTWPDGIRPVVHYSESKEGNRPQCHSDYIKRIPNSYGFLIDIMLECKAKELALLNIRDKLNSSK